MLILNKNGQQILKGSDLYLNTTNFPMRWKTKKPYNYHHPLDVRQFILGDSVLSELVSTEAFQRLKNISFLGGIDYVLVRHQNQSQRRYTRYEHSLGVARLSFLYSQELNLTYEDRRLACVSALLHDVGHAPLSHSLEKTFLQHFDIEHHAATKDIITGRAKIGRTIFDTLRWHGIDVDRVVEIIDGKEKIFDGFFSGPINFDTIEGILRTHTYTTKINPNINPVQVVRSAIARTSSLDIQVVDEFWMYKDLVYRNVINSTYGVLADKICQKQMEDNIKSFSREDYFIDEKALFTKIPRLKNILISRDFMKIASEEISFPVEFNDRRFFIDKTVEFSSTQDALRYKQTKEKKILTAPKLVVKSQNFGKDFLDDNSL